MPPGGSQEGGGDAAPRWMAAVNRIRLTGRLARFPFHAIARWSSTPWRSSARPVPVSLTCSGAEQREHRVRTPTTTSRRSSDVPSTCWRCWRDTASSTPEGLEHEPASKRTLEHTAATRGRVVLQAPRRGRVVLQAPRRGRVVLQAPRPGRVVLQALRAGSPRDYPRRTALLWRVTSVENVPARPVRTARAMS